MDKETELKPCPFDAAMWKGEPSGNPEKGWIKNSRGVRLTRLGSRHFFGKLISDHNKEIEFLKNKIPRADQRVPLTTQQALDCVIEHLDGEHEGKVVVDAAVFNALYDAASDHIGNVNKMVPTEDVPCTTCGMVNNPACSTIGCPDFPEDILKQNAQRALDYFEVIWRQAEGVDLELNKYIRAALARGLGE